MDNFGNALGALGVYFALILYRWPRLDRWFIEGKQGVIGDLQDAFAQRYRWRA
jgi:hypothetical protein